MVREWIDVLSREDYQAVANALGYALSFGRPPAECIEMEIKRYRSPRFYPGVERFVVSDWRTAHGGNPEPYQLIRWYKPNSIQIKATVELDLPMNLETAVEPTEKLKKPNIHADFPRLQVTAERFQMGEVWKARKLNARQAVTRILGIQLPFLG